MKQSQKRIEERRVKKERGLKRKMEELKENERMGGKYGGSNRVFGELSGGNYVLHSSRTFIFAAKVLSRGNISGKDKSF